MIYNYNCNYATTKQLKTTATATTTTARRIAKQEKNPQLTDNNQQQLANSMQNQIFELPNVATGEQNGTNMLEMVGKMEGSSSQMLQKVWKARYQKNIS